MIEEFSEKILAKTRDAVIEREFNTLDGFGKGIINHELGKLMAFLSPEQKEITKKMIIDVIDASIHELLYNLDENEKFKITVTDDKKIIDISASHDENLVGMFLDSIDDYSAYNSSYNIIRNGSTIEKYNV